MSPPSPERSTPDFDLRTWHRPFVTAKQLASYVDVDPRTIIRMIELGSLKGTRVGRSWRIPTAVACAAFHVEQAGERDDGFVFKVRG